MFDRTYYKKTAWAQLKYNAKPAVLVGIVFFVINACSIPLPFVSVAVMGILSIAASVFFLRMSMPYAQGITFYDFLDPLGDKWFVGILAGLWSALWIFLWSLLFVIPGIVKTFSYSQTFFILAENPKIPVRRALKMSQVMTHGFKADLFVLFLSFLGWLILSGITLGILLIWVIPYMYTSYAHAYRYLKETAIRRGVLSDADFKGVY